MASPPCAVSCGCWGPISLWNFCRTSGTWTSCVGREERMRTLPTGQRAGPDRRGHSPAAGRARGVARTAGPVCHVCITRHWFFCRGLALQPFILCFAVGPNGFEKFCYSPVTPEANVRIDFTCTGLHHLSRAGAVRAKAKWKAIHTKLLRQPLLSAGRGGGGCGRAQSPAPREQRSSCTRRPAARNRTIPEQRVLPRYHTGWQEVPLDKNKSINTTLHKACLWKKPQLFPVWDKHWK